MQDHFQYCSVTWAFYPTFVSFSCALIASRLTTTSTDFDSHHRLRCPLPQSEPVCLTLIFVLRGAYSLFTQDKALLAKLRRLPQMHPRERRGVPTLPTSKKAHSYQTCRRDHTCSDIRFCHFIVLPGLSLAMPQCLGPEMERSARSGQLPCRSRALSGRSQGREEKENA